MIYKVNDMHYVISSKGTWLPGSYESEKAARYAFQFTDQKLYDLQTKAIRTNGGIITTEMLKELRKR